LVQLAARLDEKLALLTGGSRGTLPRHWTLRAAVEWSYDLLNETERRLFSQLAVFAGPFTEELAAVVCDGSDHLESLVAKSLVTSVETAGEEQWYRLLETLRDYAIERLRLGEADEERAIRVRHVS